jgi:DNA-binding CsgD family transcriptional regulator
LMRIKNTLKTFRLLTAMELEVLKWIRQGKNTWDMSVILGISERTVKFHVGNILRKLDATTRAQAVAIAAEQRLLDID